MHLSLLIVRSISIFLALAFSLSFNAQSVIELHEKDDILIPGLRMAIYEDVSAKKTIEEISSEEGLKLFKAAEEEVPNPNVTASAIWCRFFFTSKEDGPWLLEMGNPSCKTVDVYTRTDKGKFKLRKRGLFDNNTNEEMNTYHIFSHLEFSPNDTIEVFVKLQDVAPLQAYFFAGASERFFEHDHKTNLFHGIFYGIMILMILYNTFLYITNHDRVYLYYILYILFNSVFISFFIGHVGLLPEGLKHSVLFRVPVIIPALMGTFGALFTMQFLYTKKLLPFMHKLLWANIACALTVLLISIMGFPRVSLYAIQFLGFVLAATSITTGILALKKCFRQAGFYVLGYGAYLISLLVLIFADLGVIDLYKESRYILECGAIVEAVMLSFAIGDKLNSSNREKNEAKEEALRIAELNAKLIKEQNIVLEQKVEERTRELNMQKEIVEEKNKDIISSIEYAKRIQRSLLPTDKYIQRVMEQMKNGRK